MRVSRVAASLLVAVLAVACQVQSHDEVLAGNVAADFLSDALIKQDSKVAYEALSEQLRRELPFDEFERNFGEMARIASISSLSAEAFELPPYSDELRIYLSANTPRGTGYFAVSLIGDQGGYSIQRIQTVDQVPAFSHEMAGRFSDSLIKIERVSE